MSSASPRRAPRVQQSFDNSTNAPSVDLELVIAVDVSYSMDMDELAVQREGYAQAIVSKDVVQALKNGPNSKIAVTYFEWSASSDQKIIIPWRVIDGPETADAVASEIMSTCPPGLAHLDFGCDLFRNAAVRGKSIPWATARHRYLRGRPQQQWRPCHRRTIRTGVADRRKEILDRGDGVVWRNAE
jgi:hypothetical protein